MLNFFRGGPLDGTAYETTTLLETSALALPLDGYRWTDETIISQITGKTAKVWVFGSTATELAPQTPPEKKSIFDRRKSLKLSRSKLAALAGITESQMWRAEQPNTVLKPGTTEAIEEALTSIEFPQ